MAQKKLVTEACVRAMAEGSELQVGGDVLATPAALDLAFRRGIRVVWTSGPRERGRRDGARTRADELWSRMLAEDGNYVVSVRAGRAIVHRMTPDGPAELGAAGGST